MSMVQTPLQVMRIGSCAPNRPHNPAELVTQQSWFISWPGNWAVSLAAFFGSQLQKYPPAPQLCVQLEGGPSLHEIEASQQTVFCCLSCALTRVWVPPKVLRDPVVTPSFFVTNSSWSPRAKLRTHIHSTPAVTTTGTRRWAGEYLKLKNCTGTKIAACIVASCQKFSR